MIKVPDPQAVWHSSGHGTQTEDRSPGLQLSKHPKCEEPLRTASVTPVFEGVFQRIYPVVFRLKVTGSRCSPRADTSRRLGNPSGRCAVAQCPYVLALLCCSTRYMMRSANSLHSYRSGWGMCWWAGVMSPVTRSGDHRAVCQAALAHKPFVFMLRSLDRHGTL